jgi:type IV pilus assembly protein PilM
MAGRTAIGLDIGTSGLRAAEVSFGRGQRTLERFGQIALPVGAVVDGEVVDVEAVSAAIRALWSATRFRSKKVALGVANQRVIVRQVDLPWLPPAELKASLPYQVQDFIPLPVDQVLLDYHAIEEVPLEGGGRGVRGLLVAAAREMVFRSVEAVQKAGLSPVSVDLVPFAVLRSMSEFDNLGLTSGEAVAVVDVGASVTNLIVHTGGIPRFVRILPMGGADITDALAERLGLTLDEAEGLKQSTPVPDELGDGFGASPEAKVIDATAGAFVHEIRTSLDYYQAQPTAVRIGRLVLTGGGGQLNSLGKRLSLALRLPVDDGSVLASVELGKKLGLTTEQLTYLDPLAAVPVGLAMGAA